jgi:hypothetical protein
VWSGWVGIAQKTGFGLVRPLPGIWPSLHLDTAITLPIGVEAYAAYALRAWLARDKAISVRTRRFVTSVVLLSPRPAGHGLCQGLDISPRLRECSLADRYRINPSLPCGRPGISHQAPSAAARCAR